MVFVIYVTTPESHTCATTMGRHKLSASASNCVRVSSVSDSKKNKKNRTVGYGLGSAATPSDLDGWKH